MVKLFLKDKKNRRTKPHNSCRVYAHSNNIYHLLRSFKSQKGALASSTSHLCVRFVASIFCSFVSREREKPRIESAEIFTFWGSSWGFGKRLTTDFIILLLLLLKQQILWTPFPSLFYPPEFPARLRLRPRLSRLPDPATDEALCKSWQPRRKKTSDCKWRWSARSKEKRACKGWADTSRKRTAETTRKELNWWNITRTWRSTRCTESWRSKHTFFSARERKKERGGTRAFIHSLESRSTG